MFPLQTKFLGAISSTRAGPRSGHFSEEKVSSLTSGPTPILLGGLEKIPQSPMHGNDAGPTLPPVQPVL